jgi:hypothetical protein
VGGSFDLAHRDSFKVRNKSDVHASSPSTVFHSKDLLFDLSVWTIPAAPESPDAVWILAR